jgi:hypothetical protein
VRIVFGSLFLSGLIAVAAAYTTGVVFVLKRIDYWDAAMGKTTVLWFLGVGLVTAFSTKRKDRHYFLRLVVRNLGIAAVIDYLTNIHPFPLYVWLVLVPIILLFTGVEALAQVDPQQAAAEKLSSFILSVVGLFVLASSLAYVVRHFGELATIEKTKDFLLPLLLTTCFIPFLYALALFVAYQMTLTMTHLGLRRNEGLYPFTRRMILRSCGFNLGRTQFFEEQFRGRLWGMENEAEVAQTVDEFRQAWKTRRSPSPQPK